MPRFDGTGPNGEGPFTGRSMGDCVETVDNIEMAKTQRGKRDGTGPYKDSYRQKSGKVGRRKAAGVVCPQKKK